MFFVIEYNRRMSWASRRRASYGFGVTLFLMIAIGGPIAYWYFSQPATCTDGARNQGETSPDKGGPCALLDERMLSPYATLWSRSFRVRDGSYNAIAYVHNPNKSAGVRSVAYRFGLYDTQNVLVAERLGRTYIMPGALTPIFEGAISTGQRVALRTQFEFVEPLVWERLDDASKAIRIIEREVTAPDGAPRITARVQNTAVKDVRDVTFIATVFDPVGNAFAASQTTLSSLAGGATEEIIFTWPDPFGFSIGSIDISALAVPVAPPVR